MDFEEQQKSPYDCEHDLLSSNKMLRKQSACIEQASAKICKGSDEHFSNLVVTCIIRHPPPSGTRSRSKSRSRSPIDMTLQRRPSSHTRQGRNNRNDYLPYRMASSRSNASYGSSAKAYGGGSSVGAIYRMNRSGHGLDVSTTSASGRSARRKKRGSSYDSKRNQSAGKRRNKSKIKPPSNNPQLLTTMIPSKYLVRGPPGLQSSLLKVLLKGAQDVYNCQQAFEEAVSQKTRKSMKVFEFDNCIGETNGH